MKELVKDVFKIFDKDGNKTIDRAEATKHWSQVRFGKISANEFFNTVDFNNDGEISENEFIEFWQIVKGSGHTEEEIREEVTFILNMVCSLSGSRMESSGLGLITYPHT